jgi:hypothetical protein
VRVDSLRSFFVVLAVHGVATLRLSTYIVISAMSTPSKLHHARSETRSRSDRVRRKPFSSCAENIGAFLPTSIVRILNDSGNTSFTTLLDKLVDYSFRNNGIITNIVILRRGPI